MKKIIFFFSFVLAAVSGFSQVASAVRQDTGNARLLRIVNGAAIARALNSTSVTTTGTVTAGAKSVIFTASADFTGTIDGQTFSASFSITFTADTNGKLPAIPYTVSAGNLIIRKIY